MAVLEPQTQIAGRYGLLELLGVGSLGELWRAHDDKLVRHVALRLVPPRAAAHPAFRETFRHRARAWAAVCDPGGTLVFDFGEQDRQDGGPAGLYLVLELVDGVSLAEVLAVGDRLSPARTLDVLAQAASTLHTAHRRGVFHGNVKPSNLLLRTDGVVKVTDFAVDRAPAGAPATAASDLYALGMAAHQCLAGGLSPPADDLVAGAAGQVAERSGPVPGVMFAPVADLVGRLIDEDPERRPADAASLAAEAVALCRRLGRHTSRPPRELLGGDAGRLVG